MTESQLHSPRYPLDHLDLPHSPDQAPQLHVSHRRGLAFCQVMARAGHDQDTATALGIVANTRLATAGRGFTALPLAPGRWMLTAEWGRDGQLTTDIGHRVHGAAYASEQSHGRAAFRITGPDIMAFLGRECRLDLALAAAGFVGQTTLADVGVLIHKIDSTPTFDLIVYTGYAEHFWNTLTTAAQPFNALCTETLIK